jgi:hypothetical protein
VGGHSGQRATYQRLHRTFVWPAIKQAVIEYVDHCGTCKQAKHEKVRYPGFLQPLPIATSAWQTMPLDFVEGLPRSKGQ